MHNFTICSLKGSEFLHPYSCDLADFEAVKKMMEWVEKRFESLQILINNAGIMIYGPLLEQKPQEWTKMMDVNLISVSYVTQLASKIMGKGGDIIFINSMAGHVENDNPMTALYNAGKFALTGLIENWRRELKEKSIIK